MKLQQKPRKLITLSERLKKDMYVLIPLSLTIFYLNIIQLIIESTTNTLCSGSSIDRISTLLLLTQILFTFVATDSLEQVKTAYKSQLLKTPKDKKIKKLHDFRVEFPLFSTIILYISGGIRFFTLLGDNARGCNEALLSVSFLLCVIMYFCISSERKDIAKILIDNRDRFYD